jgi:hypothetical protein
VKVGGDMLDHQEMYLGQVSYIWQLSHELWDRCRIIFFEDEPTEAEVKVFGIVVKTGDGWEQVLMQIARSAWVILLFPSTTPSCLLEMRLLREKEGLLDKVILVMPPMESRSQKLFRWLTGGMGQAGPNHAEPWELLRTEMAREGYNFPSYEAGGMFFTPKDDFSIRSVARLKHNLDWSRLSDLRPGPGVLRESLGRMLAGYPALENDRREWGVGGLASKR